MLAYTVDFLRELYYNIIPHGAILREVGNLEPHPNNCYYWCGTCYIGGRFAPRVKREDMKCETSCLTGKYGHCRQYKCPENELPVTYDYDGYVILSKKNKICGTNLHVIIRGCYCSKDYPYRRQGDYKCVKEC